MQKFILLLILLFPVLVVSQPLDKSDNLKTPGADTTEAVSDTTESERVLTPGAESYLFYDSTADPLVVVQAGAFIGMEELGMEATLRNTRSDLFATLLVNSYHGVQSDLQSYRNMMSVGLTGGKEILFRASHSGPDASRFYGRVGPGVGVAGASRIDGTGRQTYVGIHSTVLIGGLAHLSRNTSIFAEVGARTSWFPAMSDVGVIAGPQLTIGFQFSRSPSIPPVRY